MSDDNANNDREYLSVREVATQLKVRGKTVREWIARGEIEACQEFRIRRDHLDEDMEARRVSNKDASGGGLWDPDAGKHGIGDLGQAGRPGQAGAGRARS